MLETEAENGQTWTKLRWKISSIVRI